MYLTCEGVDLSLSLVQSPCQLADLLVALVKLTLHSLQLQTQRLPLRLVPPNQQSDLNLTENAVKCSYGCSSVHSPPVTSPQPGTRKSV